ncbi:unnamed protein product [Cunninghamella blakesleeana]
MVKYKPINWHVVFNPDNFVFAMDDRITVTLPKKDGKYESLETFCKDWRKTCADLSCDVGNELCEPAPHAKNKAQVYCIRRSCKAPYTLIHNWTDEVIKALKA